MQWHHLSMYKTVVAYKSKMTAMQKTKGYQSTKQSSLIVNKKKKHNLKDRCNMRTQISVYYQPKMRFWSSSDKNCRCMNSKSQHRYLRSSKKWRKHSRATSHMTRSSCQLLALTAGKLSRITALSQAETNVLEWWKISPWHSVTALTHSSFSKPAQTTTSSHRLSSRHHPLTRKAPRENYSLSKASQRPSQSIWRIRI